MSDTAIKIEGLGKRYRIGLEEEIEDTLVGALNAWMVSPLKNFKRLRKLSMFDQEDDADVIWALRNVSFDVARGEVLGVIGRNGAGKSTMLKILSRITEPTEGRAVISGRVASLLEVGTGFHTELTGRENIYLNGTVLGMSKAEVDRKFDEIVAFSEVEKFIDTPVKRYSSGMRVRLAFAVAAHLEPEILLIDEVLAVGDHSFQKKCLGKMEDVAGQGRTVLFVSHQMDMIRDICERCVLLDAGGLTADGMPERVISEYLGDGHGELTSFTNEPDKSLDVQLVGGRLLDRHGELCTRFDVFEPIVIELEYAVRRPKKGTILYMELDRNGGPLLWSFDSDTEPERLEQRCSGRHRYRLELPAPLLKPGVYHISAGAGIANRKKIHHVERAFNFEVQLISRASTFASFAEKRPGSIATAIEWCAV
jgi:lipopolysaccharide transport system ATP-binding protein